MGSNRCVVSLLLALSAACAEAPAAPSPSYSFGQRGVTSANGIVTWTSIDSSRPLCAEIWSQVGGSWPIWVAHSVDGDSILITISETPLPAGPMDESPAVFIGRLGGKGGKITASRQSPSGGMACPGDSSITPLRGGELTAELTSDLVGDYTEIYGEPTDPIVFHFHFSAEL